MSNSSTSPIGLCSTCHELFEVDDLSTCVSCNGRTCMKCVPKCCLDTVMESVEHRLLSGEGQHDSL
jgi:hypothetical protein